MPAAACTIIAVRKRSVCTTSTFGALRMCANLQPNQPVAREGLVSVRNAELYWREIGQGQPILVLHGGPDFSHNYLLPDMDRLAVAFRLIYYDQRGRGKSAHNVQPDDVSIQSEVADLDAIREFLGLESLALLGHSWGGVLAMEYAIRHPQRVSHVILMNSAAASHEDYILFQEAHGKRAARVLEKQKVLSSTAKYQAGDPQTVAEYYRLHFSTTLRQAEQLERLIDSLRASFTSEGILKAWAIEERLMNQTQRSSEYDLLPLLKQLRMPALVIHGEYDFIPVEVAIHIAQAIPRARLLLLQGCGHFTYLECPQDVRKAIVDFLRG